MRQELRAEGTRHRREFPGLLEGGAAVLAAAAITGITAVLPMVASVGRLIYANNVPVMLMSMKFGPVGGMLYAAAASFLLNNIGMGSGVLLYVLLFQMAEAALAGLLWHNRRFHVLRYGATVLGGTFLLKPLSFLLYYLFHREFLGDRSMISYVSESYAGYLRSGWQDTLLLYGSGILCGYFLNRLLELLFKGKGQKDRKYHKKEEAEA